MNGHDVERKIESKKLDLKNQSNRLEVEISGLNRALYLVSSECDERLGFMVNLRMESLISNSQGSAVSADIAVLVRQRAQEFELVQNRLASKQATLERSRVEIANAEQRLAESQIQAAQIAKNDAFLIDLIAQSENLLGRHTSYLNRQIALSTECKMKREEFEADPVFMALMNMCYGTDEYKASFFKRLGHKWMAKRANFEENLNRLLMMRELEVFAEGIIEASGETTNLVHSQIDDYKLSLESKLGIEAMSRRVSTQKVKNQELEREIASLKVQQGAFLDCSDTTTVELRERVKSDFLRLGVQAMRGMSTESTDPRERELLTSYVELTEKRDKLKREIAGKREELSRVEARLNKAQKLVSQAREMGALSSKRRYNDDFDADTVFDNYIDNRIELMTLQTLVRDFSDLPNGLREQQDSSCGISRSEDESFRQPTAFANDDDLTRRSSSYSSPVEDSGSRWGGDAGSTNDSYGGGGDSGGGGGSCD
ncbi:hypothetical protein ACYPKM_00985 [Pseudomonas aeruginosa]